MIMLLILIVLIILIRLYLRVKITDRKGNNDITHIQISVPLIYFSNFWRTLENA